MGANVFYPCDRGVPGNVIARGMHHFDEQPSGRVVCRYCGAAPTTHPTREDAPDE